MHKPYVKLPVLHAWIGPALLVAFLLLCFTPGHARAVVAQATPVRATTVGGMLGPASYHYLGLEPALRDGTIVLTIALEPADDLDLRGAINFIVLTDDGLRRVLAGANPTDLDIAASAPLEFDRIGNKYQAVFKASGNGQYTVIVYNSGGKIGGYKLTALNGVLLDDAGQIEVVVAAPEPFTPPTLTETSTPTETMQALVSVSQSAPLAAGTSAETTTPPAPVVNALRLSSMLDPVLNRHFLSVKPAVRDGTIGLDFVYEPRGRKTDGYVNFWIVDEDGMRRVVYGAELEDVNIATGFPVPFNPDRNELVASIHASGSNEYTVVPYSIAPISVTYVLQVDGGVLIDRYGQTNEARAARAEFEALSATAEANVASAAADQATAGTATTGPLPATLQQPAPVVEGTGAPGFTLAGTDSTGSADAAQPLSSETSTTQIEGTLPLPFTHNYWGLTPALRDGVIAVTLDYAPRDVQELRDHVNFWVVDEDGLRRIVAGARPEDVALASGAEVRFGPDKGKLQGVFRASGRGVYAVIVFNASAVPATYTLRADGGQLLLPPEDDELIQALP